MEAYNPTKPLTNEILKIIRETHPREGPVYVRKYIGTRPILSRDPEFYKFYNEVPSSDGIGQKGILHWAYRTFDWAAQDALSMAGNDMAEVGAMPYFIHNQIKLPREDKEATLKTLESLVKLCESNPWVFDKKEYPIIVSSGDTAYEIFRNGMEVDVDGIGLVEKGKEIEPKIQEDDLILAWPSNYLNSNGFTFLLKFYNPPKYFAGDGQPKSDTMISDIESEDFDIKEILKPTPLYFKGVRKILSDIPEVRTAIHGMKHITSGGLTRLKDLIESSNNRLSIYLNLDDVPEKVKEFYKTIKGKHFYKNNNYMFNHFNMGVGFVIIVDPSYAEEIQYRMNSMRWLPDFQYAPLIGNVKKGEPKIEIKSYLNDEVFRLL